MGRVHLEGGGSVILVEGDRVDLEVEFLQVGQFPELAEHCQLLDVVGGQFDDSEGL